MPCRFPALMGTALVLTAFASAPLALAAPTSAPAKPSAASAKTSSSNYIPHAKSVHAATVQSVDTDAVHLTLPNGETMDADIKPTSLFLKNGKQVTADDFAAGEKVFARTRARASDGGMTLVTLADAASLLAIDAQHGKTLIGKVTGMDEKYWQVQPDGAATPLLVHMTPKTVYRKAGKDGTGSDFAVGSLVAIATRGGSNGMLNGQIVSDTSADAAAQKAARKVQTLSGVAHDVDADKGTLTVMPKSKPKQTIAITPTTKIKVRTIDATLKDITDGMHVTVRFGHDKDAAGHFIASSLSATDPAKKKTAAAKKTAGAIPAAPKPAAP